MLLKYLQHMCERFFVFAHDPVAVLAHHGQLMQHYGLPRRHDAAQVISVELVCQVDVNAACHVMLLFLRSMRLRCGLDLELPEPWSTSLRKAHVVLRVTATALCHQQHYNWVSSQQESPHDSLFAIPTH